MRRMWVLLALAVLLTDCGTNAVIRRDLNQATVPSATSATSATTLTIDQVVQEFRAHGLQVATGVSAPASRTPAPRDARLIRQDISLLLALYEYASEPEAIAFAQGDRSGMFSIRYFHRNIGLECSRSSSAQANPITLCLSQCARMCRTLRLSAELHQLCVKMWQYDRHMRQKSHLAGLIRRVS